MRFSPSIIVVLLSAAVMNLVSPIIGLAADAKAAKRFRVYIGTYTGPESNGIYHSTLDLAKGELSAPQLAAEVPSPSFVAIHPNQKFLYAVSELTEYKGRPTGAVYAYAIDRDSGRLQALNDQPSEGEWPCHLVVDQAGKNVLVANYGGGSVAVLPIDSSGKLLTASSAIKHTGTGTNPERQEKPHAHSINLDAANRFAFAADLGLDKILIYRFDSSKGSLVANTPPSVSVSPGHGPRHFAFHPSGKYAFLNNEMTSSITSFRYDSAQGVLQEIQTLSTLPAPVEGNSTAETVVHPSGKFVYVSNRGHDSLALFHFDENTGTLVAKGQTRTGGKTPRNFNIDPTGTFLIAANQSTNDLVLFRIDGATGNLTATKSAIEVGAPVCVRFLPLD
ncbi:MAG: lactonase family protein [Planctomycetes bacterium]|nr:lactonase family protein [Planctomycetota bacterium]